MVVTSALHKTVVQGNTALISLPWSSSECCERAHGTLWRSCVLHRVAHVEVVERASCVHVRSEERPIKEDDPVLELPLPLQTHLSCQTRQPCALVTTQKQEQGEKRTSSNWWMKRSMAVNIEETHLMDTTLPCGEYRLFSLHNSTKPSNWTV